MKIHKSTFMFMNCFLLFVSYVLLMLIWYHSMNSILMPYGAQTTENYPPAGHLRTVNNFFLEHHWIVGFLVLLLITGSAILVWHRIVKRNHGVNYVMEHTYITNFLYIFIKIVLILSLPFLSNWFNDDYLRPLHEIYLSVIAHAFLIFILFLIHHKNITFGKLRLPV